MTRFLSLKYFFFGKFQDFSVPQENFPRFCIISQKWAKPLILLSPLLPIFPLMKWSTIHPLNQRLRKMPRPAIWNVRLRHGGVATIRRVPPGSSLSPAQNWIRTVYYNTLERRYDFRIYSFTPWCLVNNMLTGALIFTQYSFTRRPDGFVLAERLTSEDTIQIYKVPGTYTTVLNTLKRMVISSNTAILHLMQVSDVLDQLEVMLFPHCYDLADQSRARSTPMVGLYC